MKAKAPMNESVTQPKRIRRKFDKAFKQRAVELWLNSGRTATEVAAELGIKSQRLSAWKGCFGPPPPGGEGGGGPKRSAEQLEVENTSLRREIEYLRIAVEKTAGPAEQEAWGWLMEKIRGHYAAAAPRAP